MAFCTMSGGWRRMVKDGGGKVWGGWELGIGAGIQAPLRDVSSSLVSRQSLGLVGQLLPGSPLKLTLTISATCDVTGLVSSMSKVSGNIGTARALRGIIPTRLALATVIIMIYRRLLACES